MFIVHKKIRRETEHYSSERTNLRIWKIGDPGCIFSISTGKFLSRDIIEIVLSDLKAGMFVYTCVYTNIIGGDIMVHFGKWKNT